MKIDKETAEALGLKRVLYQTVAQALFLLISLTFVGYMLMPLRDAFTTDFRVLVADVREIKVKVSNCDARGRVAQAR
jgi:hypothetical protein